MELEAGLVAWLAVPGKLAWPVLLVSRAEREGEWILSRFGCSQNKQFNASTSYLRDFVGNFYLAFSAVGQNRSQMAKACIEVFKHVRDKGVAKQVQKFTEPEFRGFLKSVVESCINLGRKRLRMQDKALFIEAKEHQLFCNRLAREQIETTKLMEISLDETMVLLSRKRKKVTDLKRKLLVMEHELREARKEEDLVKDELLKVTATFNEESGKLKPEANSHRSPFVNNNSVMQTQLGAEGSQDAQLQQSEVKETNFQKVEDILLFAESSQTTIVAKPRLEQVGEELKASRNTRSPSINEEDEFQNNLSKHHKL